MDEKLGARGSLVVVIPGSSVLLLFPHPKVFSAEGASCSLFLSQVSRRGSHANSNISNRKRNKSKPYTDTQSLPSTCTYKWSQRWAFLWMLQRTQNKERKQEQEPEVKKKEPLTTTNTSMGDQEKIQGYLYIWQEDILSLTLILLQWTSITDTHCNMYMFIFSFSSSCVEQTSLFILVVSPSGSHL